LRLVPRRLAENTTSDTTSTKNSQKQGRTKAYFSSPLLRLKIVDVVNLAFLHVVRWRERPCRLDSLWRAIGEAGARQVGHIACLETVHRRRDGFRSSIVEQFFAAVLRRSSSPQFEQIPAKTFTVTVSPATRSVESISRTS
jgi:hypothetical protein